MNPTLGNQHDQLEEQLFELVYGLLEPDEARALRRRVTSEPDVARAYARVVQQSERLALAAQWEEPPLPLSAMLEQAGRLEEVKDVEPEPTTSSSTVSPTATRTVEQPAAEKPEEATPQPPAADKVAPREREPSLAPQRWLAAMIGGVVAATVLVAACLVPSGHPGHPIAENHPVVSVVGASELEPGTPTVVAISTKKLNGEPVSDLVQYGVRDAQGETVEKGEVTPDASGNALVNFKMPDTSVTFFAFTANSPQVEVPIARKDEVAARVEPDRKEYQRGDVMRIRVAAEGKKPLPDDTEVLVIDGRGMVTHAVKGIGDNGVAVFRHSVPVNSVEGVHEVVAINGRTNLGRDYTVVHDRPVDDALWTDGAAPVDRYQRFGNVPPGPASQAGARAERLSGGQRGVQPASVLTKEENGEDEVAQQPGESRAKDLVRNKVVKDGEPVRFDLDRLSELGDFAVLEQKGNPIATKARSGNEPLGQMELPANVTGTVKLKVYSNKEGSPRLLASDEFVCLAPDSLAIKTTELSFQADRPSFGIDVRGADGEPKEVVLGISVQYHSGAAAFTPDQLKQAEWREKLLEESLAVHDRKLSELSTSVREGDQLDVTSNSRWYRENPSTPVTFQRESEFASYRRLFAAGSVPPSMVLDGDGERFVEREEAEDLFRSHGRLVESEVEELKKTEEKLEDFAKLAIPHPQVRNNSLALGVQLSSADDFAETAREQAASGSWAFPSWVFLAIGGVVLLVGLAATLSRRADAGVVWIPAGMVTAACLIAALWQTPATETFAGVAPVGEEPPAAKAPEQEYVIGDGTSRYGRTSATIDNLHRSLAVAPTFFSGEAPSNDILGDDGFDHRSLSEFHAPSGAETYNQPTQLNQPVTRPASAVGGPDSGVASHPEKAPRPQLPGSDPADLPTIEAPAPRPTPAAGTVAGLAPPLTGPPGEKKGEQELSYRYAWDFEGSPTVHWDPTAKTDSQGRARVVLDPPAGPGFYKVRITADYEGKSVTTERLFRVK